jgi:GNAT superfamily N-acetyltransferase
MIFREANTKDIPQIQLVRNAVKENILSDPSLVTDADCEKFLNVIGKGWVCEAENNIVGFAIIDLLDKNIWALFVHPRHDKKGIGRQLHDTMLDWYFEKFDEPLWLGTSPKTRAEEFYRRKGWTETGTHAKGEIKFGMDKRTWIKNKSANL